jgi:predicted esterase
MRRFIALLMIINSFFLFAQNVKEVKRIELSKEFNETVEKAIQLKDSSIYLKIENLENGLNNAKSQYEKYRIIFNSLGPLYTTTKQFDKAINLWITANNEGVFFPFELNQNNIWPSYISNFVNNKRFDYFLRINDSLKVSAASIIGVEYFVRLPDNYNAKKKYPLIIILHGGSGDNNSMPDNWNSLLLRNNFISVYPHGNIAEGSYAYSYGQSGIRDMKEIYKQVISNYPVDTSMVIIGGQSNGGQLSIQLAYNEIPIHGLFLAFPTIPNDFDNNKALVFKNKDAKVVIICGEKDGFYSVQLQMAKALDSAKVENRFINYPELGHYFPKDFSDQLDKGLLYLTTK